jgi:predicted amidohydrolase
MKITVTGIQMGTGNSKKKNVEKARLMLESLKPLRRHPQFICLPEMFSYVPNINDDFAAIDFVAEEINGPISQMFAKYAVKLNAYIITGSYIQRKNGKHYNTSLLFSPDGDLLAQYSKIHLFDTPDFKESSFVDPGDHYTVFDTKHCKVGMIICYDIRFPELLRTLSLKGAEVIFCPAAFPMAEPSPGVDHWEILTKAASLYNMVYLVAVNQFGIKDTFTYFGRSVIVDPWGIEIAKASNKECIISAELDLRYLREMRQIRSPLQHRKPGIYDF